MLGVGLLCWCRREMWVVGDEGCGRVEGWKDGGRGGWTEEVDVV